MRSAVCPKFLICFKTKMPSPKQVIAGCEFQRAACNRLRDSKTDASSLYSELYEFFHAILDGRLKSADSNPLLTEMVGKLVHQLEI